MELDRIYHEDRLQWGAPLEGLRVLAAEHMQALPFGTQLLAELGAEVIKVEPPGGEAGRKGRPLVPQGAAEPLGGTFARNNLNKSSITLDLKKTEGRELFLRLAQTVDVVAENMRPGVMDRLGLGYDDIAAVAPQVVYLSVSGFGNRVASPYRTWPAYAPVAEAMSGLYELGRVGDEPPRSGVAGALGDISAALFAVIGTLAAVKHRERTGLGQHVDVSMFDSMIAMNDMYAQVRSLGLPAGTAAGRGTGIMTTFRASDGYFLIAVIREHQLARLAEVTGHPEWMSDERLAERSQWSVHIEDIFRPAIEGWAGTRTRLAVVEVLADAGVPAGPCFTMDDLVADEHVESHNMFVQIPTTDGNHFLMPGNPIKMSRVSEGPWRRFPDPGQDTENILAKLLDLDAGSIERFRMAGVFG